MIVLAYIDIRPFLFAAGLPAFILLSLLVCRILQARASKGKVIIASSVLFSVTFTVFLTGLGPFINQTEVRDYMMTWEIKPPGPDEFKQAEVIFSFIDFPGHFVTKRSDQLAEHLRTKGEDKVNIVFEVTLDYGKLRGFSETEIAGLKSWQSVWGTAGTLGSPSRSPWD